MDRPLIRPEVADWMRRWREVLAAAAAAALGLWWALTALAPLSWLGAALVIGGAALGVAGWQRARFRRGGGAGVVVLDEGRLTYFGPLSGGTVAVRAIRAVGLDPRYRPPHWVLHDGETALLVPVDAEGVESLLDVFARLPGLDMRAVQAALDRPPEEPVTLWRRAGDAPRLPGRLH